MFAVLLLRDAGGGGQRRLPGQFERRRIRAADERELDREILGAKQQCPGDGAVDGETGQTLLRGMGELHLQICVETLKEDFGIDARIGAPQVAWRSAPTRAAEIDHQLRKQNGGPGQMARVRLAFVDRSVGGAVPKAFVPAIDAALQRAMSEGGPDGHPVLGLRATLLGGAFHEKDSLSLAFAAAAREAFRIGYPRTGPVLLKPLMRVTVTTPGDYLGAVIGDLQARRGRLLSAEPAGVAHAVVADVPLAKMFAYVGTLRSLSQGRAGFAMAFARYAPTPVAG